MAITLHADGPPRTLYDDDKRRCVIELAGTPASIEMMLDNAKADARLSVLKWHACWLRFEHMPRLAAPGKERIRAPQRNIGAEREAGGKLPITSHVERQYLDDV